MKQADQVRAAGPGGVAVVDALFIHWLSEVEVATHCDQDVAEA